jgi:predicted phosphodiesterase
MRKLVFVSDIHANYEALTAVFDHIDANHGDCEKTICLGDVFGYGASPVECWNFLARRKIPILCGNHDASLYDQEIYETFNPYAKVSTIWTQDQLKADPSGVKILEEVESLRGNDFFEGIQIVHASPNEPISEYLLPSYLTTKLERVKKAFSAMPYRICFHGHSHMAGVFILGADGQIRYVAPTDSEPRLKLDRENYQYLINPGSVGQPRDEDSRASYCTIDLDTLVVTWFRVPYDIKTAQAKIIATNTLNHYFAERLATGS